MLCNKNTIPGTDGFEFIILGCNINIFCMTRIKCICDKLLLHFLMSNMTEKIILSNEYKMPLQPKTNAICKKILLTVKTVSQLSFK